MKFFGTCTRYVAALLCFTVVGIGCQTDVVDEATGADPSASSSEPPRFVVDPYWPKPLPNDWLLGRVGGMSVDSSDHIWVLQRPGSLTNDELGAAQDPPLSMCCKPAPPVLRFDPEGNLVGAWGGPADGFDWPSVEHGLFVDHNDNVWVGGEGPDDHQVLKFTSDGEFLLQIGVSGKTGGGNHKEYLGHPADLEVFAGTNELFIADGYLNKRVIVFDAETGEYKRHWGAYGNEPASLDPDVFYLANTGRWWRMGVDGETPVDAELPTFDPSAPPEQQFRVVHGIRVTDDGLVYVADRANNRVQVFELDGTFKDEVIIAQTTLGEGSVWDVTVSPDEDQTYLYVTDGANQRIWILRRGDLEILDAFGRRGRGVGEFHWVHKMAVDSHGNIYTGEVHMQRRVQKFMLVDHADTD